MLQRILVKYYGNQPKMAKFLIEETSGELNTNQFNLLAPFVKQLDLQQLGCRAVVNKYIVGTSKMTYHKARWFEFVYQQLGIEPFRKVKELPSDVRNFIDKLCDTHPTIQPKSSTGSLFLKMFQQDSGKETRYIGKLAVGKACIFIDPNYSNQHFPSYVTAYENDKYTVKSLGFKISDSADNKHILWTCADEHFQVLKNNVGGDSCDFEKWKADFALNK